MIKSLPFKKLLLFNSSFFKQKNFLSLLQDSSLTLSEEQLSIQKVAFDFANQKLSPYSAIWEEKHHFPVDVIKEAAQYGFGGIYTSPEYGGCGLKRVDASVIFEALAVGNVPISAYLTIHNMCCWIIDQFGSKEQKDLYLNRLTSMDILSSYCLTEPGSGSDSASMKTFAKKDGEDFIINGSKCFISGGGVSDFYIVMCQTKEKEISSIIVEKGTKGLTFGKLEEKMGWRISPTTMVMFDDVRVPSKNLISTQGNGFKIAMKALDGGRINIGSCSLGGALYCLEKTQDYMKTRNQFGKPLSEFQYLGFKFAELLTEFIASRLMIRHAAIMIDHDSKEKNVYAAMAKLFATDHCSNIVNQCLQLHGGYGYLSEYGIERVVRDLRVHQILEGTNEIMRLIISRNTLK